MIDDNNVVGDILDDAQDSSNVDEATKFKASSDDYSSQDNELPNPKKKRRIKFAKPSINVKKLAWGGAMIIFVGGSYVGYQTLMGGDLLSKTTSSPYKKATSNLASSTAAQQTNKEREEQAQAQAQARQVAEHQRAQRNAQLENQVMKSIQTLQDKVQGLEFGQQTYNKEFDYFKRSLNEVAAQLNKIDGNLNQLEKNQSKESVDYDSIQKGIVEVGGSLRAVVKEIKSLQDEVKRVEIDGVKNAAIYTNKVEGISEKLYDIEYSNRKTADELRDLSEKVENSDFRYSEANSVSFSDGITITERRKQKFSDEQIIKEYYFDGKTARGFRLVRVSDNKAFEAHIGQRVTDYSGIINDFVQGVSTATSYLVTENDWVIAGRDKYYGLD